MSGSGIQVTQELRKRRADDSVPCAAGIIQVENGKVKGSGNRGEVKFTTNRVGEARNKNVLQTASRPIQVRPGACVASMLVLVCSQK